MIHEPNELLEYLREKRGMLLMNQAVLNMPTRDKRIFNKTKKELLEVISKHPFEIGMMACIYIELEARIKLREASK